MQQIKEMFSKTIAHNVWNFQFNFYFIEIMHVSCMQGPRFMQVEYQKRKPVCEPVCMCKHMHANKACMTTLAINVANAFNLYKCVIIPEDLAKRTCKT